MNMLTLLRNGAVFLAALVVSACSATYSDKSQPVNMAHSPNSSSSEIGGDLPSETPPMVRHVIEFDHLEREYYEFTPTHGSRDLATLIFLHGYGGTATGTQTETTNGLNRYAQQYGYRVIYPQGTWFVTKDSSGTESVISSWNDLGGNQDDGPLGPLCSADAQQYPCPPECGSCGRCGWTSCHDDLGFIGALVEQLQQKFPESRNSLFISGFSNGSMMAQRAACEFARSFRAVALVGGRLEIGYSCVPDQALPLLQINGGMDSVVPYEGRQIESEFFYTAADTVAQEWSRANGCTAEEIHVEFTDVSINQLICHSRCDSTLQESTNCYWPDGAHIWPGYPQGHGSNGYCVSQEQSNSIPKGNLCVSPNTNVDVWGSRVLFEFFDRHRL